MTGESLDAYVDKLADMGAEVGRTASAMISSATEFRKNGFNDEDSAQLAQISEMFRNVSDEEISSAQSASFIISQLIAFRDTLDSTMTSAEQAETIISAVNETANRYSVSSGQLSQALGNVASTSAAVGNSMSETLGMLTAITEQTRNASKASRSLNMIFSRLSQVLDESSTTGQKLTEIYEGLGIALYDTDGQIRSSYDILKDLAGQWGNLSKNEQEYIALTSAGRFCPFKVNCGKVLRAMFTKLLWGHNGGTTNDCGIVKTTWIGQSATKCAESTKAQRPSNLQEIAIRVGLSC